MFLILTTLLTALFIYKIARIMLRNADKNKKSFQNIPGPKSYPFIGTLYLYWQGKYNWSKVHEKAWSLYKEYGPIVKEDLLPGVTILHLFDEEDFRKLNRAEAKFPSRRSHTALLSIRKSQPSLYNTGGLLPTNGSAWATIRKQLQKPISSAVSARQFVPALDEVMQDTISFIESSIETLNCSDLMPQLFKIFMEVTGAVTLDHRLDCLQIRLNPETLGAKLIEAAVKVNKNVLQTDNCLFHKFWKWESREYAETCNGVEVIQTIARMFLEEKLQRLHEYGEIMENEKLTLIEHWLKSKDLDINDVATAVEDFLLAGVETSSFAAASILYVLAQNPNAQSKIAEECLELFTQSGGQLTSQVLSQAKFTNACLKESLRLYPVSVGFGRKLTKDTELSGYPIPGGTIIVANGQITSRLEKYFEDPDAFKPDRWLNGSVPALSLASCPFGVGSRVCIAKSIAETALQMFMMRIFSKFQVSWVGGDLEFISVPINKPNVPMLFKFDLRN